MTNSDDSANFKTTDARALRFKEKVSVEKLRFLYENLPISIPASLICTSIVFISLFQESTKKTSILLWFVTVFLLSLLRLLSFYYYRRRTGNTLLLKEPLFVLGTFLSAALWGVCAFYFMPPDNLLEEMIIVTIISGITAGSVQTLMASFRISALFIICSISPLSIWFFLQNDTQHFILGVSTIVYLIFMMIYARHGEIILEKLINLHYENLDLIHELEIGKNILKESETRFRSAFDFAAIGMALVSLQGRWLKVNASFCQLIGYSEEQLLQIDFQKITYPDDLNADLRHVQQLLEGKINTYQMEKRFICKNGDIVWSLLNVSLLRDADNKPLYFISQIQSIDAQKKAEEELKKMAFQDVLTGLANRKQLEQSFKISMNYAKRHNNGIAVLFLDLDYYKEINDTLGHTIGDLVLIEVASRLKTSVRASDMLVRMGGDEFLIILTEISSVDEVYKILGKIFQALREPMKIRKHQISMTGSIGISIYPTDGVNLEMLIKNADNALYAAKSEGRNNFKFYENRNRLVTNKPPVSN